MIRPLAITALALLSACAGTELQLQGSVCGQPVNLVLQDRKDRSAFEGEITCPGGGRVWITSTDSSTSAVLAKQAEITDRLVGLVERFAPGSVP